MSSTLSHKVDPRTIRGRRLRRAFKAGLGGRCNIAMVCLGLLLIWSQVTLASKMQMISVEVANVATRAYSEKLKTGAFPDELGGYDFLDPDDKDDVSYMGGGDNFRVSYHIGTRSTSHWCDFR
ncbi:MAG TPA: hypothetical protein VFV34_07175 [Blastocatellia bacterium]|nr:hypothetical protein [Blastocatellia bacterium]